jgi:hypothetical protein
VSVTPKALPGVVKEIVGALVAGDWTRYADDSGDHFYYVIRERDRALETQEHRDFNNLFILGVSEAGAFEDWFIRAALAEEPTDRLATMRKRIVAAGVDPQFLEAVIVASRSAHSQDEIRRVLDEWMPRFVTTDLDGLNALLEALRIDRVRQRQIFVADSHRPAIRDALEMRFLRELAERFPKVVKRATEFDWLSFSDPQIREASRCYLYGFFRAAVLVSAAALEDRLKSITGIETLATYDALVDSAFGVAGTSGFDPARALGLKELFKLRNRIAHSGAEATQEDAARALDLVRETFETLAAQTGDAL